MKITYWSDYACPFCYIGETRMKKAIAAMDTTEPIELEMKAFQLDPKCTAKIRRQHDRPLRTQVRILAR